MGVRNNGWVSDLIDTTEMYLRTIYELVEEGIVPVSYTHLTLPTN